MSNIRINYQFNNHKRLIIITDTANKIEFRAEVNMVWDSTSVENWIAEVFDRFIFIRSQKNRVEEPACIKADTDTLLFKYDGKKMDEVEE